MRKKNVRPDPPRTHIIMWNSYTLDSLLKSTALCSWQTQNAVVYERLDRCLLLSSVWSTHNAISSTSTEQEVFVLAYEVPASRPMTSTHRATSERTRSAAIANKLIEAIIEIFVTIAQKRVVN